jgi:Ribonuclease G/E
MNTEREMKCWWGRGEERERERKLTLARSWLEDKYMEQCEHCSGEEGQMMSANIV